MAQELAAKVEGTFFKRYATLRARLRQRGSRLFSTRERMAEAMLFHEVL
jgi:hypothetical protein